MRMVCFVGAGLLEYEDESVLPTCPQFIELFSLIPNGRYVLLDNNAHALKLMRDQFSRRFASYDPIMLRACSFEGSPGFVADARYQALFQQMKDNLARVTIAPMNADEMLAGFGKLEPLLLRFQEGQVEVRDFDINSTNFGEGEQFNIIVATMSIFNASHEDFRDNPHKNHFGKLTKFLLALKENGSLFMDMHMMEVLRTWAGPEMFGLGIRYLEMLVGNELLIEEIPVSDFQEKSVGTRSTLSSLSTNMLAGVSRNIITIDTSAIVVITRTANTVDLAEKNAIALQLLGELRGRAAQ